MSASHSASSTPTALTAVQLEKSSINMGRHSQNQSAIRASLQPLYKTVRPKRFFQSLSISYLKMAFKASLERSASSIRRPFS